MHVHAQIKTLPRFSTDLPLAPPFFIWMIHTKTTRMRPSIGQGLFINLEAFQDNVLYPLLRVDLNWMILEYIINEFPLPGLLCLHRHRALVHLAESSSNPRPCILGEKFWTSKLVTMSPRSDATLHAWNATSTRPYEVFCTRTSLSWANIKVYAHAYVGYQSFHGESLSYIVFNFSQDRVKSSNHRILPPRPPFREVFFPFSPKVFPQRVPFFPSCSLLLPEPRS
ncbi:hypothetical protein VNO77_34241 [Canavalia gladiata]|uniref:Uncharacterized protein n=1 Tax=Canavalia gladiata TaxID=3824 RepID=A0AAN9KEQ9_CANGL